MDQVFIPGWLRQVSNTDGKWLSTLSGEIIGLGDLVAYYVDTHDTRSGYAAVGKNVMVLKESSDSVERKGSRRQRRRRQSTERSAGAMYEVGGETTDDEKKTSSTRRRRSKKKAGGAGAGETTGDEDTESEEEVTDGELEWLEKDLQTIIDQEDPQTKTLKLLMDVHSKLNITRGSKGKMLKKTGIKTLRGGYTPMKTTSEDFWRMRRMLATVEADYNEDTDPDYTPGMEVETVTRPRTGSETQADTSFSIEDAKWIKDDIVQVEIPKLLFQSTRLVSLSLIIGDTNYGVRKLKLENTAAVMEQCWSSSQDPVSMFSEALNTRFLSISDVDEYLSASVERKMNLSDLLCSTTTGCHRDQNNVCRCEDQDHSNLLHWSAGHGLTRLSETLIKTGFTRYINLPNIQGLTPLDLAERHGDTGLVRMLKNHLLNLTLSSHQYPVTRPRSNTLLEDADGYLIPHTLEDIVSGHRTVEDTGPGHRLKQRHVSLSSAEEFYQRPPTPRPLTVSVCSIATGTTASTTSGSPPGASITSSTSSSSSTKCRSAGYIKMVSAPLKKAMSEPRSEAECFIPKSGSFSHFTMTNKKPGSALSREELIAKYCRDNDDPHTRDDTSPATSVHDDSRPESTPPDLGSHHHSDNISIPHHHHHDTQDSDSSPLDHYVHTDPHLDGKIIISYLLVSLTIFVLKSYPLIIVL